MTWLAVLRRVLGDPVALILAAIVGILAATGGYFYGHYKGSSAAEAKQEQVNTKAENTALKDTREVEHKAAVELNDKGKNYVEAKETNKRNADAVNSEFIGLRVKSKACNDLPTSAPAASGINAARTTDEQRGGTSEVDFADVTRQVTQLGNDYDNAISKIGQLQETIKVYQSVCGIPASSP